MSDILLRAVAESDLPFFFEYQLSRESSAMAAVPSRDREAFDAHWKKIMADENTILRTIEADGQVAGHLVSFLLEQERQVGYWLGREYWGKGIATKALAEFLKVVEPRPLFGRVAKHNPASKRVLEKCGFTLVGEDQYTNRANEVIDDFIFRLDE